MEWQLSLAAAMMKTRGMCMDVSGTIRRLNQVKIFDYFKNKSMPGFVEPSVTKLVDAFLSASNADQAQMLDAVSPALSSLLGWYSRKLAGRAVRDGSRTDLWNGLIALLISTSKGDVRDAMAPLALLYNSALRLQEDPRILFESASRISQWRAGDVVHTFLNRPPDLKSIQVFGYSEGLGPEGFDYVPLLPEYGGPSPIVGQ